MNIMFIHSNISIFIIFAIDFISFLTNLNIYFEKENQTKKNQFEAYCNYCLAIEYREERETKRHRERKPRKHIHKSRRR